MCTAGWVLDSGGVAYKGKTVMPDNWELSKYRQDGIGERRREEKRVEEKKRERKEKRTKRSERTEFIVYI